MKEHFSGEWFGWITGTVSTIPVKTNFIRGKEGKTILIAYEIVVKLEGYEAASVSFVADDFKGPFLKLFAEENFREGKRVSIPCKMHYSNKYCCYYATAKTIIYKEGVKKYVKPLDAKMAEEAEKEDGIELVAPVEHDRAGTRRASWGNQLGAGGTEEYLDL